MAQHLYIHKPNDVLHLLAQYIRLHNPLLKMFDLCQQDSLALICVTWYNPPESDLDSHSLPPSSFPLCTNSKKKSVAIQNERMYKGAHEFAHLETIGEWIGLLLELKWTASLK
jgi:hypothetical protein